MGRPLLAAAFALLVGAAGGTAVGAQELELVPVVSGLARPLELVHAGDGSGRLFVALQGGRVLIVEGGALLPTPFLDISDRVRCCGERGLLGLAFHPDYAQNGRIFVHYTGAAGETRISRFAVSAADPNRADAGSEVEVLTFSQPFSNHNGGRIAFGPDGMLYIASGDGGGAGDPQDNAQSLDTFLGKILRIDVDGLPYAIPPDNPFVGVAGALPEIWAYGLRNPWKIAFDRETGDLWIADVGQNSREEIDFQGAASAGGENYGWRRMEGSACFSPASGCNDGSLVLPVAEYGRELGCSVTGGYRYRGRAAPALAGLYFFGDFCSGRIWALAPAAGGGFSARVVADTELSISSFGEDESGELYVVHIDDSAGAVFRLESVAIFADGFESGDLSAWSRRRGGVAVIAPGLFGTDFALAAPADDPAPSFVAARLGGRDSVTVDFAVSANAVALAGGSLPLFQLMAGRAPEVTVELERAGRRYRVALVARDGGRLVRLGATRVPRRRAAALSVEWRRGGDGGLGAARLLKSGRVRVVGDDLDNAGAAVTALVTAVRLGLPDGGGPVTEPGAVLLDEVSVRP